MNSSSVPLHMFTINDNYTDCNELLYIIVNDKNQLIYESWHPHYKKELKHGMNLDLDSKKTLLKNILKTIVHIHLMIII